MTQFVRTGTRRYKRLSKHRIKQRWRKPRGRHNKLREKKKSRQRKVEIGYRTEKSGRGMINGKYPLFIRNLRDAEKITSGSLVIIMAKIGKRKRAEIVKKIEEKGGEILKRK